MARILWDCLPARALIQFWGNEKNDTNRRAVLGISGASGSIYALRLAKILLEAGADLYCIPTRAAVKILADETGYADFNTAIAAQLERIQPIAESCAYAA